jgi:hypothetical protein
MHPFHPDIFKKIYFLLDACQNETRVKNDLSHNPNCSFWYINSFKEPAIRLSMPNTNYPPIFVVEIDKDYGNGVIEREEVYAVPANGHIRYFIKRAACKIEQINLGKRRIMTWNNANNVCLMELTEDEIENTLLL